jgi:hypothetical protein
MALNYTYLFDSIRQYIMAANTLEGWMEVYDDAEEAVEGALATASQYDRISGVPEAFVRRKDALVSTVSEFARAVDDLLGDKELCRGELPVGNTTSVTTILPALFHLMLTDSETLAASVVTIGSVTPDGDNVGDATLLIDGTLDGATPPHSGWPSLRDYAIDPAGVMPGNGAYAGRLTELSGGDSLTVICTRDSQTDKTTEGTESFTIIGNDAPQQPYDWRADGSGSGGNLSMANGSGLLTNGEFETWTGTTPDFSPSGWTLGTGASVGTTGTIIKEDSVIKRGLHALQIKGKTGVSTISISQAKTNLTPLKRYLVAAWIRGTSGIAGSSALTISFTGTGYTAATATEKISLAQAALAALTTYTLEYFWVTMPESIPSDFALTITASGSLTNGEKIYIDGMVLAPATYFGGLAFAIVAGGTPVMRDDRWTCTVTTAEGGVQRFFRKVYHTQLPSLTAASTITDTVTAFS